MATSSEEVLLIVPHVRYKKSEGSLYMMGERLAWMLSSKQSFTVSHNYADIKVQKISPETKEKVQLQVSLHDGGANTFQFSSPAGRPAAIKEREGVKELLQQLLPKFRRKINSELEEKNRMLQENKELFQLYKDLVVTGVISADEFWANRVKEKNTPAANGPSNSAASPLVKPSTAVTNQEVGVSASFLADIKPQSDGCNGLKYNITSDTIESIFKTYPAVKHKYMEHVPHSMTEAEFWTKFFQSHYFHRDRINIHNKDLFAECAKKDEQDIQEEITATTADTLVDLTRLTDESLDEGYGNKQTEQRQKSNYESANLSIIRRFNHHSTMILKTANVNNTSVQSKPSGLGVNEITQSSKGINEADKTKLVNGSHQEPSSKRAKLKESTEYVDLVESTPQQGVSLNIGHRDRYLQGPTEASQTTIEPAVDDVIDAAHVVRHHIKAWKPIFSRVLSSTAAMGALTELSPGGALMQDASTRHLQDGVNPELQQEVKQIYSALCELLRHFWSCFPITTPTLEDKVVKMRGTLERFQTAKLQPFKDKEMQSHCPVNLTNHLDELLATAYRKYDTWQARKQSRR